MNKYLQIVRAAVSGNERNEFNETTHAASQVVRVHREPIVLEVTGTQKEMADIVAKKRVESNNATRKANQDAGAAGNYSRDYCGALAEIVARQWLESQGVLLETQGVSAASALVSDRPDKRVDLVVNGCRIDIKSSRPDNNSLTINRDQHLKRKPSPDSYFPCLFDASGEYVSLMALIPHAEVSEWSVATGKNGSQFYHAPRAGLMPLYSLSEMMGGLSTDVVTHPSENQPISKQPHRESAADNFDDLLAAAEQDMLPTGFIDFDEPGKTTATADLKKYVIHTYRKLEEALRDRKATEASEHTFNLHLCRKAWGKSP